MPSARRTRRGRCPSSPGSRQGRRPARPLAAGEAMGISTGGVVPDGADAVIQHEVVVENDNKVSISSSCCPGSKHQTRGRDVAAGGAVISAGTRLGAAQIGALAAAGVAEVVCARRPRVAVLTTGSELNAPGSPLGPGEVYEANGVMLAAQLEAEGAVVTQTWPPSRTTRTRIAAPSSRVSSTTCSSPRAASRSARTTSSAGRGGARRRGGLLARRRAAGQARVVRRPRARRSSSASRATRSPRSSAASCSCGPALRALQGASDPGPRFAAGRLAVSVTRNRGARRSDAGTLDGDRRRRRARAGRAARSRT